MRANVPLRDARPAVIVCPHCARHLMEVKDVQWALTRLEFTFACAGCGTEVTRAIAGDAEVPAQRSRASALLRELPIFTFSPERIGTGAPRPERRPAVVVQEETPRAASDAIRSQ